MTETKQLRIYGFVQGVGFRMAMAREAARLELTGWVRNRTDGSVEATVQGPQHAVAEIIEWARRGPRGARVERLLVSEGEGVHPEFSLLPTR
jgi:acylphosphatase